MRIRVPPKRIRERFLIIYELEGCQKAVNFLTDYCGVRRMKIVLDGRKVGRRRSNHWVACYLENKAYFTKKSLMKRIVLHESYHHLTEPGVIELPLRSEEREANIFAKKVNKG